MEQTYFDSLFCNAFDKTSDKQDLLEIAPYDEVERGLVGLFFPGWCTTAFFPRCAELAGRALPSEMDWSSWSRRVAPSVSRLNPSRLLRMGLSQADRVFNEAEEFQGPERENSTRRSGDQQH